LGLSKPDSGSVVLHGIPLNQIAPRDLAQSVGVAGADYGLLRGSLQRNLCYRWPGIDSESLQQVIEYCGLESLLARTPDGLRLRVTESGHNLSSGERQRIGLARALVGQPAILMLDEPETSLDAPGLSLLNDLIDNYAGTILLATHNQALARRCDRCWRLPLSGAATEASSDAPEPISGSHRDG